MSGRWKKDQCDVNRLAAGYRLAPDEEVIGGAVSILAFVVVGPGR
ncbi:hypothetical protein [Nocardia sp. NPDC057668]